MELYHIHLLGNHDNLYKSNSEIIINKNSFNNRLYERVMRSKVSVPSSHYPNLVKRINEDNKKHGIFLINKTVNLPIISEYLDGASKEEFINYFKDVREILYDSMVAKRELSIENFRRDKFPDKPSRLHSVYACNEEGIEYFAPLLYDADADVYRIEVLDEVFRTNEQLLPKEETSYIDSYKSAIRYFNPRMKDLNKESDEYLVQGKVKILEKVAEIRSQY